MNLIELRMSITIILRGLIVTSRYLIHRDLRYVMNPQLTKRKISLRSSDFRHT